MHRFVLFAALGSFVLAQSATPEKKLEFEVASIRPVKDDGGHSSNLNEGRWRTHNLSVKRLIARAYGVEMSEISGGPSWVDGDGYDINAKIPEGFEKKTLNDAVPQMIQSLLADRFQLVIHRESRQVPGFDLVMSKKGPKMTAVKGENEDSSTHQNNTHLTAENVTMGSFARTLSNNREIGMIVIDKTGLSGGFTFQLDWAPEKREATDDRPSIFSALQEQLGLKLEQAKVTIQAVVIDKVEKPEAN